MKRNPTNLVVLLLALIVMQSLLFANVAQARRRHHRRNRHAVINEPKLFERVGGPHAVAAIAGAWVKLNSSDQRLTPLFNSLNDPKVKADFVGKFQHVVQDQLCELSDGPCTNKDSTRVAVAALSPMQSSDEQFLAYGENLYKSMQSLGIREREKNEMLGRLGESRQELQSGKDSESDSESESGAESD